ncbi:MAG: HlyD family efflux transporter periplasmic adaptor subunit [Planctomycetes bacterium]|nr:HlyD family efflux transporter periplasmic adaptor subunit [Planctomycetota bacterium]
MKKLLLFLILVGGALAGIAAWINYPRRIAVNEKIFSYAPVERGRMMEAISATGIVHIESTKLLLVGSTMPGTVVGVFGKVNDMVQEGDVLLKLDDRKLHLKVEEARNGIKTAEAALAQANASLAQAQALHEAARLAFKYQKEIEAKGGFRSERDQAEVKVKSAVAGVQAAEAGVKLAKAQRQGAEILGREAQLAFDLARVIVPRVSRHASANTLASADTAASDLPPHDYLIVESKVQLGQQVGPGGPPLFTLARDLDRIQVLAQVAEGDIGKVKKGLLAAFTVSAFSDENVEFRGKVKEIRPVPANVKGAIFYDTVVDVDNQRDPDTKEWRLRPGMTAAVDVIRRRHDNVWKMPSAALNFQMEEPYQSTAAKAHLAEFKQRADQEHWRPIWIWDEEKSQPWPVFVRVGGQDKNGEPGIKDGGFNEVLEWEAGRIPSTSQPHRVIIAAPPAQAPGFLDRPANIKVS